MNLLKMFIVACGTLIWWKVLVNHPSVSKLLNLSGLTFGLIGSYFLAGGYLIILIHAATGFGGGPETFDKYVPKEFWRGMLGISLLLLAFALQAAALV